MKPLVGISCCSKSFGPNGLPNHAASDFCVRAVSEVAGAVPVLLPATGNDDDVESLLSRLDGILLTGSRTNVAPLHYGGTVHAEGTLEDPARDATTLPLIRAAIARKIPILAICRGMQELNVALGGSLFQQLKLVPGRTDHAAAEPEDSIGRVRPAHPVKLTQGGLLHRLAQATTTHVNSLHNQGIDRVGRYLAVEAVGPDGTVEGVRVSVGGFGLGVQWHPEFDAFANPLSSGIFRAFGEALRPVLQSCHLAAD